MDTKNLFEITQKYYSDQLIKRMNQAIYGGFGKSKKLTKREIFFAKLKSKVKDMRIWLGEKIAGETFYDDY